MLQLGSFNMMSSLPSISALVPLLALLYVTHFDDSFIETRNDWDHEYDFIVVGGGSAGAVVASRLSENPHWKVLLLEAGGSGNVFTDIPLAASNLQMTPYDWAYQTVPQEFSAFGFTNRILHHPRGKALGGSSAINHMIYMRGNRRDYDNWAHLGCDGWSYEEVLPYFIKSEDNQEPAYVKNGYHGVGGYLTISTLQEPTPIALAYPEAGKFLGYETRDLNGPIQTGFMIPQAAYGGGTRCSTAKAFLLPAKDRRNLHIVYFAHVTKILFNKYRKAIGVQFDRSSSSHVVHARKEIILSAGVFNSPQLLMLSGVGPAEHLESLGIPVVADLPVGQNLQDHFNPKVHFLLDPNGPARIQDSMSTLPNILKYFKYRKGPLTSLGALEGVGFLKTKYANYSDDSPDAQIHLFTGEMFGDNGETFRMTNGVSDEFWEKYYVPFAGPATFNLYSIYLHPKSRGYVKLRSTSPYDPPIIDNQFLSHPDDLPVMVDLVKLCIALGLSPPLRKFGAKLYDRVVPGCESYAMFSDEYIACWVRSIGQSDYHPVGTCRMGAADDPRSVVDPQLRVLGGVKGLRVVDASIMPVIVSGNLNGPSIMIGEKGADLVKGFRLRPARLPYKNSDYGSFSRINRRFIDETMAELRNNYK